jgi:hypothetical protein
MRLPRIWALSAGMASVALGCGGPPPAPGPVGVAGPGQSGAAPGTVTDPVVVLDQLPVPNAMTAGVDSISDAGVPASEPLPSSSRVFAACTNFDDGECDYIYITMQGDAAVDCVQLTLNNCGSYGRALDIDAPLSWQVSSGSLNPGEPECVLGEFYAEGVAIVSATGSIDWNREARQPSGFVIDVTLQPATSRPGTPLGSVSIATQELSEPLAECEG